MDLPKIDFRYLKEAFKEPINFWGMAGFAVAAAYMQDIEREAMDMQLQDKLLEYKREMGLLPAGSSEAPQALPAQGETSSQ